MRLSPVNRNFIIIFATVIALLLCPAHPVFETETVKATERTAPESAGDGDVKPTEGTAPENAGDKNAKSTEETAVESKEAETAGELYGQSPSAVWDSQQAETAAEALAPVNSLWKSKNNC